MRKPLLVILLRQQPSRGERPAGDAGQLLPAGHAVRSSQRVRVHRCLLGDGLPRRPREVRRADTRHSPRRRSDRPLEVGGKASAALIERATLKVYPDAPHGITDSHKEQLNADLLPFVQRAIEGSTSPAISVTAA